MMLKFYDFKWKLIGKYYFQMAGEAHVDESQFKGMSKYFNGSTMKGRANVSGTSSLWIQHTWQFLILNHWHPALVPICGLIHNLRAVLWRGCTPCNAFLVYPFTTEGQWRPVRCELIRKKSVVGVRPLHSTVRKLWTRHYGFTANGCALGLFKWYCNA